jgi:hypothetical protein
MTRLLTSCAITALTLGHAVAGDGSFAEHGSGVEAMGFDPASLTIEALDFLPRSLTIEALAGMDALSGHDAMLLGEANAFWGTFVPQSLTIEALGMEEQSLTIEALSLTIEALSLTIEALAAFDEQSLTIEALSAFSGQSLTIEALAAIDPQSLTIEALGSLGEMSLTIEALSALREMSLTIEALAALGEQSLTIEALSSLEELSLTIEALSAPLESMDFGELSLTIEALAAMQEASLTIEALSLTIEALDMTALAAEMSAAEFEQLSLTIEALGGLDQLSLTIEALGANAGQLLSAMNAFEAMIDGAEAAFGDLVTSATGQDFEDGFLAGFRARHGLEGSGFFDLLFMDEADRAAVMIDLSDQLTTFLGIDHPDHWMGTTSWSPRIAEIGGYGEGVTIGIVDQGFAGKGPLQRAPQTFGPVHAGENHGRAVAGVAAGALDGIGVMGVAPEASIVLSNPFPASGEADTDATANAIADVGAAGASIINLSVGEAGYTFSQDWVEAFARPDVAAATPDALFVMAAGNSGAAQPVEVDFGNLDMVDRIVLVGALGLDGEIAGFSNTAGDACFNVGGVCTPMMDRFIVAPGELILIATEDGVGRGSGTSFAAPMVAGAAALLQNRWGWLSRNPEETAEILFRTATDLGEAGIDGVYGHGLLNIEASQRPFSVMDLEIRTAEGAFTLMDAGLTPELLSRVDGMDRLTVFEDVGDTYRDFEIPVGILRAAVSDPSVGFERDVETYFGERLGVATGATQSVSGLSFTGNGFTDTPAVTSYGFGSERSAFDLTLVAKRPAHGLALPAGTLGFETHGELVAKQSGLTLRFGQGDGALAFAPSAIFSMTSDHDVLTGGVNPFVGLASGGAYARSDVPLTEQLTLSAGFSARSHADLTHDAFSGAIVERVAGTEGYSASAADVSVSYAFDESTRLRLGLTSLTETDGLFGGQSVAGLGFGETAESRSVTAAVETALPRDFHLALSGTVGKTQGGRDTGGVLTIAPEGAVTTAFQASLVKTNVFGDRMRFSVAQPLHVESGALATRSFQVADRSTGELALTGDRIGLTAGERRFVGEAIYGTPVLGGRADLVMFGQYDTAPIFTPNEGAATAGLRLNARF